MLQKPRVIPLWSVLAAPYPMSPVREVPGRPLGSFDTAGLGDAGPNGSARAAVASPRAHRAGGGADDSSHGCVAVYGPPEK